MSIVYTDMFDNFGYTRVNELSYDAVYSSTAISSGTLIIGYKYTFISEGGGTADFSNIGFTGTIAEGESFYATGTTPTEWGGATVYIGQSPKDIINKCLASARLHFTSIADATGATYSEVDEVANALMYYTMYLLYVRNQKFEEGEDEKRIAYDILMQQWGDGVRRYLEGNITNEADRIIREVTASVEREDHAEYDEIDFDEQ